MPISQDRMICLIDAARDALQALQTICDYARQQGAAVNSGAVQPIEALNLLCTFANEQRLLANPGTPFLVNQEFQHFRRTARRNDRVKEKQTKKRRKNRVPVALVNTAPSSITDSGLPPMGNMLARQGLVERRTNYLFSSKARERIEEKEKAIELGLTMSGLPLPARQITDLEVEAAAMKLEQEEAKEKDEQVLRNEQEAKRLRELDEQEEREQAARERATLDEQRAAALARGEAFVEEPEKWPSVEQEGEVVDL